MSKAERRRRWQLRFRNILRGAERRQRKSIYDQVIASLAGRIMDERGGGGAPKHGHRPPGVVALDDDVIVGGAQGRGRYRLLNFRTGLFATDDGDRVDIDAYQMGPFEFDHLVDKQWAAEVSAGRGTEGQTFTTFHGQSFKVWSVIQSAIDDFISEGGNTTILVVPGDYSGEDVSIETHLIDASSHRLVMTSPPSSQLTVVGSITVAGKLGSVSPNYPTSRIENFRLTGDLNLGTTNDRDLQGISFTNLNVAGDMVFNSDTIIFQADYLAFDRCRFGGGVSDNSKIVTLDLSRFTSCSFNGRFSLSFRSGSSASRISSTTFTDCSFRAGMDVRGIDAPLTSAMFSNCYLRGTTTESCFDLKSTSAVASPDLDNLSFAGCHFEYRDHDAEWAFIKIGIPNAGGSLFVNLAITGCTFAVPNLGEGEPPIHILWARNDQAGAFVHAALVGNSFIENAAGSRMEDLPTSSRSYSVKGYFERSVFGPNCPADFEVNLQGGTKNLYVGTGDVIGDGIVSVAPGDKLNILYDNGSLSVGWNAFITREDNVINSISAGTLNTTDDDTSYYEVLGSTVSQNTTGYTLGSIPLGVVVASSGDIDSITEETAILSHPQAKSIALPVIGTPTYKFVEDMNTLFHSAGHLDGGTISDSDNQQIDVAAGRGAIRIDTNSLAQLKFFDWAGVVNQDITVDTIRYVGVEYNNGSPQVAIRESENWNLTTDFPLGEVTREGSILHPQNTPWKVGDHARFMAERMHATNHIARDNFAGGFIFGESGARFITVTAGTWWVGLTSFPIGAINTNNGDDFDTYSSKAASDGLEASGVSQWPNGQYDNGGTLTNLGTNKWANLWWYLELDGGLVMIYGTAQYATQAQAEAETQPTTRPNRLESHGTLSSRFIFQEGAATAAQILSPFTTMFLMAGVTSHGDLADIGGGEDDHDEYVLLAGRLGGQTIRGDTASGGDLTLESTAHGTKGNVLITDPVGIGTATVPHGGIGIAKLAIDGATGGGATGPNIQITTSQDDYPTLQVFSNNHANIALSFNAYWNGSLYKSSDANANFQIFASASALNLKYDSGIAAGSNLTWNTGFALNTSGQILLPVQGSSAGLLIGGDAQIYRSNADELRTPDALIVDGLFTASGGISTDTIDEEGAGNGVTIETVLLKDGDITLGRAGEGILYGGDAANEDLLLQATSHATRATSQVKLFVDTNATMTLGATAQVFGSAINEVQFLNVTAVDFTNVVGFEIVRFSDASAAGGPAVTFATGELQVNEDIDISGHIAIGAAASVNATAGAVLVLAETGTTTAAVDVNQLDLSLMYTPAATSSAAFRGLRMNVTAGGDNDVDGAFLAGATALQFVMQHDSDGDINQALGAAGQVIIGNNPLDAVSSKTPHIDDFGSSGSGLVANFIWSSHSGYAGANDTLVAGPFNAGVAAMRAGLTLRTFQNAGRTLTIPEAFGSRVGINTTDAHSLTNRITITELSAIEVLDAAGNHGSVTIGTGILLKIGPWDSGPTYTNGPYAISQEGTGDVNWLAGFTYIGESSRISLATANNAALTVDQDNASGAIPPLILDQADVSEEMIEFITTIGVGNAIEAKGGKTLTETHFIKVTLPGPLTRYIEVGTIA